MMDIGRNCRFVCVSAVFRTLCPASKWNIHLTLKFGIFLWILLWIPASSDGRITLRQATVKSWAEEFGRQLFNFSRTYSGSDVIQEKYDERVSHGDASVVLRDGVDLVRDMANQMQAMLKDKASAVERIVSAAEQGFLTHDYNNDTDFSYYNAVLVNSNTTEEPDVDANIRKELLVTPDSHFEDIPVNTTISTIQVPTNVYNQGTDVVSSIESTEVLDDVFLDNYQQDPTLTWQYFGSRTGFFRVYPGYKWLLNDMDLDLYDCRVRGWYVEGATSPKDVVILVDMSGSMTGLYVEIAKHAIRKILDTFGDNDFVNVISFNEDPVFTQPCFNDTLVQATSDNKNLIKETLNDLKPFGVSDLPKAVEYAFELLKDFNSTDRGSGCNQAIMIISDMLTETAEDEFRILNPNQTVRVFTYQVGREIGGPTNLIKVACSNRGYYTRLATISDVEELVTNYLHVLSRPMVNERKRKTVWSSVYWDALDLVSVREQAKKPAPGLGLTCSVSQPVFNIRNETMDKGILEGVAGCDVPIKELQKFTPSFKLGINGYSFAVTNNGYILFHPELRPLYDDDEVKPNYNSVDLSEVELSDVDDSDLLVNSSDLLQTELRDAMVNRMHGSFRMTVKQMFDKMKRVSIRQNRYFYTFLDDTPYSLGISLPEEYGINRLETPAVFDNTNNHSRADVCQIQQAANLLFNDGNLGSTIIANWLYCKINYSSSERYEGEEHVARFLQDAAMHDGKLSDSCDVDMVNHLIFDANVTDILPYYWQRVFGDTDNSPVEATQPMSWASDESLNDIKDILAQIEEYCSPGGRGYTTVPPSHNSSSDAPVATPSGGLDTHPTEPATMIYTTTLPTTENVPYASFPHLNPASDGVLLSFMGTYGGLTRIYRNPNVYYPFEDLSTGGEQKTIEENYYRRAVDEGAIGEGGFVYSVPFSSSDTWMGVDALVTASTAIRIEKDGEKFVAAAAGHQMLGSALQGLLFNITNHNDENCGSECTPSCFNDSVECYLVDNHGYIVVSTDEELVGRHFAEPQQNIRLFQKLLDRDIFRPVHVIDYQGMCTRAVINDAAPSLRNSLSNFISIIPWFFNQLFVFLSQLSLYDWLMQSILQGDAVTLQRVRWVPCDERHVFYLGNKTNLPAERGLHGVLTADCDDCSKPFSVQSVPHSNLFFIMQERDCECASYDPIPLDPEEVVYNDTMRCERLLQFKTRQRPTKCFNYDPNEDSSECGHGFTTHPSTLLIITSLILAAWWRPQ